MGSAKVRRQSRGRQRGLAAVVLLLAVAGVAVAATSASASPAAKSAPIKVGLITKDVTNPFFVKMKAGATAQAKKLGATLLYAAGKNSSDNAGQITAIENMVTAGVKGILITVADAKAENAAIAKARKAGVLVVALDSPTSPTTAVDALFATNNLNAGILIGKYARAATKGKTVTIAMLDEHAGSSVGALRHNGFTKGFGIKNNDKQIACVGNGGGDTPDSQTAMEEQPPEKTGHQRRLHDQRAERCRRLDSAQERRQVGERRHHRVGRRRLRGRAQRQGRHHRRDLAAVPVADGVEGRQRDRVLREGRQEGVRLHGHRRQSDRKVGHVSGVPSQKFVSYGALPALGIERLDAGHRPGWFATVATLGAW